MRKRAFGLIFLIALLSISTYGVSAKQVELTWWYCCAQESRAVMFGSWAREYESLNPGVKINDMYPMISSGTYNDKVFVSMVGGAGPDVVWMGGGFPRFLEGFFEPLDKLVADTPDLQSIFAPIRQAVSWQGQQLGIPYGINVSAVYYNKDMLDAVGISINNNWTWEDLIRVGQRLTRDVDGDGNIDVYGFAFDYNNYSWWYGYGGAPYSADMRQATINNPENAAGLAVLADILSGNARAGVPMGMTSLAPANNARRPAWYAQKIAMHIDGVFQLQEFPSYAPFEWDVAPIPGLNYSGRILRNEPMSLESWAIWSGSPNKEEAIKFLAFISSRQKTAEFGRVGGILPTIPRATAEFLNAKTPAVNRAVYVDAMNHVGTYLEQHPVYDSLRATIRSLQSEVFWGRMAPEAMLEQAEGIINQSLNEYWSRR
ncbi:MAG TPA: sugar ABC transporter substrate-binding protein [Firmicutes bacterium]|nr:sugar ABC transporter substrate-binding protein [Bacillota bacterium]